MSEGKFKLLCVDDEPRVLHGLERHLRDRFEFLSATSGTVGLDVLSANKDLAIIISDMRMPEMDGATFLKHARSLRPDAVRILLTGHADIPAAIKAVNQGQIFRFLSKPCPPDDLSIVVNEAQRQYELVVAERTLLDRTLLGCIKALVGTMSLANPAATGRAVRLKRRICAIGRELGVDQRWQVEAAAMFSALGSFGLPPVIAQKLADSDPLDDLEQTEALAAAKAANWLIARVPRLEPVSRLLDFALGIDGGEPADALGREHLELLRLGIELDALEARGMNGDEALAGLRGRAKYSAKLLEAAARALRATQQGSQRITVPVASLRTGMILDEDLRTPQGVLIAQRGFEVTPSFLLHVRHFKGVIDLGSLAVLQAAPVDRRQASLEI
jgi:CheY-like chemotaxis protein